MWAHVKRGEEEMARCAVLHKKEGSCEAENPAPDWWGPTSIRYQGVGKKGLVLCTIIFQQLINNVKYVKF